VRVRGGGGAGGGGGVGVGGGGGGGGGGFGDALVSNLLLGRNGPRVAFFLPFEGSAAGFHTEGRAAF